MTHVLGVLSAYAGVFVAAIASAALAVSACIAASSFHDRKAGRRTGGKNER